MKTLILSVLPIGVLLSLFCAQASAQLESSSAREANRIIEQLKALPEDGFIKDPIYLNRLEGITEKLLSAMSQEQAAVIRTVPIKLAQANACTAFAMGREAIFILSECMNLGDEELAFILAHEMGHSALNHKQNNVMRVLWTHAAAFSTLVYAGYFQYFWQLTLWAKLIHYGKLIPVYTLLNQAMTLAVYDQTRKDEFDADAFAIEVFRAAGFDSNQTLLWFEKACALEMRQSANISYVGESWEAWFNRHKDTWLATHPPVCARLEAAKNKVK
jgi:Zn-dependent protease with chaperone function